MKSFVACVLLLVASSTADTVLYPRGCIYILGRCREECPIGTHAYALGCGYKVPEPTCTEPNPVAEEYMLCDYSACYCDPPTIRDTNIDKCVLKEDCSKAPLVPIPSLLPPFEDPKPVKPSPLPEGSLAPTEASKGSVTTESAPTAFTEAVTDSEATDAAADTEVTGTTDASIADKKDKAN